jgi:hypothetical protein
MSLAGWYFVIVGPIVCALAGAWPAWLFTRRQNEARLDRAYEQGWRAGQSWYPPEVAHEPAWQPQPSRPGSQVASGGAVAASAALRALPAPDRASSRHSRPEAAPLRLDDLEALARVRATFADIRRGLGLPA